MKPAAIAVTALALTLALPLAGCSTAAPEPPASGAAAQDESLTPQALAARDVVEVIDYLDRLPVADRPADMLASVGMDELTLADADQEITLALPEDRSYVSIAPYVTQTHDCFYHSLTTCLGELGHKDVHVTITDEATGETLVDEQATTFDNGFIGFWLPRGSAGVIEVSHEGRTGATEFSTAEDGATCVTDLRLT